MRENPGENCYDGGFPPTRGGGCWGNAFPDVRHIKLGSLAHVGHVGAMMPEALVKVLIVDPALSLVGHWIRGG